MKRIFVVVFGGRKFNNRKVFFRFMDKYHAKYGFTDVVSGGASGADTLAIEWGRIHKLEVHVERPNWEDFSEPCVKKSGPFGDYNALAGTKRNQLMLTKYKPQYAVEFPGGSGTKDMNHRVKKYAAFGKLHKHLVVKKRG